MLGILVKSLLYFLSFKLTLILHYSTFYSHTCKNDLVLHSMLHLNMSLRMQQFYIRNCCHLIQFPFLSIFWCSGSCLTVTVLDQHMASYSSVHQPVEPWDSFIATRQNTIMSVTYIYLQMKNVTDIMEFCYSLCTNWLSKMVTIRITM